MRSSAPREDGAARRSAHSRPGILADDLGTTATCLGERLRLRLRRPRPRPTRVQSASGISAVSPDRTCVVRARSIRTSIRTTDSEFARGADGTLVLAEPSVGKAEGYTERAGARYAVVASLDTTITAARTTPRVRDSPGSASARLSSIHDPRSAVRTTTKQPQRSSRRTGGGTDTRAVYVCAAPPSSPRRSDSSRRLKLAPAAPQRQPLKDLFFSLPFSFSPNFKHIPVTTISL